MKRTVYTAIFAAVVSVATAGNAMAHTVKTTDGKTAYHKHPHGKIAHSATFSEKEVQALQQSLRDSGFYKGTVTGKWSPMTENALASYQHANGLVVTGTLNDATQQKLGLRLMAKEKVSATEAPLPKKKKHRKAHKVEHKEVIKTEVKTKEEKTESKKSH